MRLEALRCTPTNGWRTGSLTTASKSTDQALTWSCIACPTIETKGALIPLGSNGSDPDSTWMERMRAVSDHLKSLCGDRRGSVATIFCAEWHDAGWPCGRGIDYARLSARRSQLQNAVDAVAFAGGNALKLGLIECRFGSWRGPSRRSAMRPSLRPTAPWRYASRCRQRDDQCVRARPEETDEAGLRRASSGSARGPSLHRRG